MTKNNNEAAGSVSPQTSNVHKRTYIVAPERKVSNSAIIRFHKLPQALQNTENKKLCVQQAISTHPKWVNDEARYWAWLDDQTKLLTRVWDFKETCTKHNLDADAVAQHLVLEGQKTCNFVRMNGLAAYGERIKLFKQPLILKWQKLLPVAEVQEKLQEEGHE